MASLKRDGLIVSTKIKVLNGIMQPHLATALKSEKLQSLTLSLTWIYKLKYIFGALPHRVEALILFPNRDMSESLRRVMREVEIVDALAWDRL